MTSDYDSELPFSIFSNSSVEGKWSIKVEKDKKFTFGKAKTQIKISASKMKLFRKLYWGYRMEMILKLYSKLQPMVTPAQYCPNSSKLLPSLVKHKKRS